MITGAVVAPTAPLTVEVARSTSAAPATSREWKAFETGSSIASISSAAASAIISATAARSPDTTVCAGAFTLATTT